MYCPGNYLLERLSRGWVAVGFFNQQELIYLQTQMMNYRLHPRKNSSESLSVQKCYHCWEQIHVQNRKGHMQSVTPAIFLENGKGKCQPMPGCFEITCNLRRKDVVLTRSDESISHGLQPTSSSWESGTQVPGGHRGRTHIQNFQTGSEPRSPAAYPA